MNKNLLLKIINPIRLLLFISQASSGLFHEYLSHELFELIHEKGGIILVLITLTHLYLNWGWVRANLLNFPKN